MKVSSRIPAYKMAALEIKAYIASNNMRVGDALPPEAALARLLGISRPSLREGIKALESVGVLQARHGEGVYVAGFSFDSIVDNLPYSMVADNAQLQHLLEVRTALEVGMIPKIVHLISTEDMAVLENLAARMQQLAEDGQDFSEEDCLFHTTLFQCLGNPFLDRLIDLFWKVFHRMAHTLPKNAANSGSQTAREHLEIVNNLKSGNAESLARAHAIHFQGIHRRVTNRGAVQKHPVGRKSTLKYRSRVLEC